MQTDILIVGGSTSAIAAALELKKKGRNVLLVTHRSYLGEDICDSMRLRLPADLKLADPLAARLYGADVEAGTLSRPMRLKHCLDEVLVEADIPLLFNTAVGELFADVAGRILGVSLCNRGGRRLLGCRAVVDGSLRGDLARLAGLPLSAPLPEFSVIRRVVGGETSSSTNWDPEGEVFFENKQGGQKLPLWAWTETATLADGSWDAWMTLERDLRLRAFRRGQLYSADGMFALTGECLAEGPAACGDSLWFTGPVGESNPARHAERVRHDGAIARGRELAAQIDVRLPAAGNLAEARSLSSARLPAGIEIREAPVSDPAPGLDRFVAVEEVDVLVVGGGTAGAPAGIAAAREGARTLVAEFLSGLGGVGTLGLIGTYWFGNRVGFTSEVDAGATALTTRQIKEGGWDVEAKMQWYHQEIATAGGRIWYKTMICGALRQGNRVVGAILCTPQGRIAVRAKCVVDATGSADLAAMAGAETVAIGQGQLAVQGTGLPGRNPGADYTNTDWDFIDDNNPEDVGSAHLTARKKFHSAFDAGQLVDSRERRRVVGDTEVTPMDIRLGRIFHDSVVKARSNFDTHGYTLHPLFMIVPPDHEVIEAYIPLRALLPRGLEGVLVTGLGISAHRDAMPVIRMQADVQNQGYVAGLIAALAGSGAIRALALAEIQRRLVEKGILAPEIAGHADTFPLSADEIDRALAASVEDPNQIDRVFTLPEAERNARVRRAHAEAREEPARRHFAFVLGILGDAEGVETLVAEISETDWDKGWNYTGMGQFGASMSPLDARLIALGRCRKAEGLPVLAQKAESLPADAAFSHYRALAEALGTLGDPRGAAVLEALLNRPGLRGHQILSAADRLATATANSTETHFRNVSLIELHLASALHRLQPGNPLSREVLEAYSRDLRGLFAAHARAVLAG